MAPDLLALAQSLGGYGFAAYLLLTESRAWRATVERGIDVLGSSAVTIAIRPKVEVTGADADAVSAVTI